MNRLITSIATVWIDEHGIVHKRVIENSHITVDMVKTSFRKTMDYTGPGKRLLLYDVRAHFTITDEAMDFLQGEIMGEHSIATAILGKSLAIHIMADYILHVKNIKVPFRVFAHKEEAIQWLLSFNKAKIKTPGLTTRNPH